MATDENPKPLSVTDAVKVASSNLALLIPDAEHVLLEEVELSDDDRYWFITLGFNSKPLISPAGFVLPPETDERRKYRIFKIDGKTGEVRSMKIRERENV